MGQPKAWTVDAVSLAWAAARWGAGGRIAVLKVDVQGFELEVLLGALPILLSDRPVLYFEYSPGFRGPTAPRVICVALWAGYDCIHTWPMVTCVHPESPRYH
jgi:hypothetical protein